MKICKKTVSFVLIGGIIGLVVVIGWKAVELMSQHRAAIEDQANATNKNNQLITYYLDNMNKRLLRLEQSRNPILDEDI